MKKYIFLRELFFLFCVSCSKIDSPITEKFRDLDGMNSTYSSVYQYTADSLQTLLRLEAESRILNSKEAIHIQLQAQLLDDRSTLRLQAYSSDMKSNDGTSIQLKRSQQDLLVSLYSRDWPEVEFCVIKNAVSQTGDIDVRLQFDPRENQEPHVLVWNQYFNGRDGFKKEYTFFSKQNAECSTRGLIFLNHFGQGTRWGMELYNARLIQCRRSEVL
jgi:hypothetical protein